MPPKKPRRAKVTRPVPPPPPPTPPPPPPVEEQEQPEDPCRSPPPDEEERNVAADRVPEPEHEPEAEETEDDAPARRRAAPRVVTNFSEGEKELIIEFLQQNSTIYSKRLAGYKDTAAKERLWMEQARQMNRTPNELKTWYDSMRTKFGKIEKAVSKSGQDADSFTATERWIWQRFQFLSEHITQMPRRTVASFTARLQPTAAAAEASPSTEAPEDTPPASRACTPLSTHTSSTVGTNPDLLMGLLETFLSERQSQAHPATAFGSYVDGSLRSLPPAIRRTAEVRIMEVLHECQNEAERQHFRPLQPQQPVPAHRQRSRTSYGESATQCPARPRESSVRHWQPPPSQWPAEVTNPPDVWHSMDRPWVQEQFPNMNITCPPPITVNRPRPQQPTPTEQPSTSAADVQDMSYSQMFASGSFSSLLGQIPSNLTSPNQEGRTSSISTPSKETPQDDNQTGQHQ